MKTLLVLSALAATVLFSACESDRDEYGYGYGREHRAPAVGASSGIGGHSPHSGNSDGSRTDLR